MVQSFATRQDVYDIATLANPNISMDNIGAALVTMANRKVASLLRQNRVTGNIPASTADYELLTMAAVAFSLEFLNYNGKLNWSTGDLASVTQGRFKTEYQRWQPMFFFAQGDSRRFRGLLPHETWRMIGNDAIDGFLDSYFEGLGYYDIEIKHDNYVRGYGATDLQEHQLWG